jgi:hypothetical protein
LDFGSGVGVCSEDTEVFLGGLVCGLGAAILDSPVRGWVARREGGWAVEWGQENTLFCGLKLFLFRIAETLSIHLTAWGNCAHAVAAFMTNRFSSSSVMPSLSFSLPLDLRFAKGGAL